MPDWSYHTLFKPILLKLPPSFSREFIHHGMSMLSSNPLGEALVEFLGQMSPSKKLSQSLFDLRFDSPVGLCGKIDPQLSGLKAFQNLGFGFIEIGPVKMTGLYKKELRVNRQKEQIEGFSDISISVSTAKKKLHSLKRKKMPFLVRVHGTLKEINLICKDLHPFSDGFIIQSSVFSTVDELHELKTRFNKPIILSFSTEDKCLIEKIKKYPVDGVLLEGDSLDQLCDLLLLSRELFGQELPIITSSCVKEPCDAIQLFKNGASLIMLGSEYVFSGPGLPKRINEASITLDQKQSGSNGWLWYLYFGWAITIAGLIAMLCSMTAVILPYDETFLGILRGEILDFNPYILYFMAHDRMTLSGTMISGGIIYIQLARNGIRYGLAWARKAVNIGGIIGFLGILLVVGYGYFDWLHGLFWLILLPLFIFGYIRTRNAKVSPSSMNVYNSKSWKLSLVGQLAFVLLGTSLTIGGVVISSIGASSVFVPTDLTYLCATPEALNEFNERLIPVIAHDRAGFGSALLSVGLLVLMLALWGIREGEKWVWWTLTIGAIPAFLSGLLTHFIINYTDFVHLLPAYIALLLYTIGVTCTAPFLWKKQGDGSSASVAV